MTRCFPEGMAGESQDVSSASFTIPSNAPDVVMEDELPPITSPTSLPTIPHQRNPILEYIGSQALRMLRLTNEGNATQRDHQEMLKDVANKCGLLIEKPYSPELPEGLPASYQPRSLEEESPIWNQRYRKPPEEMRGEKRPRLGSAGSCKKPPTKNPRNEDSDYEDGDGGGRGRGRRNSGSNGRFQPPQGTKRAPSRSHGSEPRKHSRQEYYQRCDQIVDRDEETLLMSYGCGYFEADDGNRNSTEPSGSQKSGPVPTESLGSPSHSSDTFEWTSAHWRELEPENYTRWMSIEKHIQEAQRKEPQAKVNQWLWDTKSLAEDYTPESRDRYWKEEIQILRVLVVWISLVRKRYHQKTREIWNHPCQEPKGWRYNPKCCETPFRLTKYNQTESTQEAAPIFNDISEFYAPGVGIFYRGSQAISLCSESITSQTGGLENNPGTPLSLSSHTASLLIKSLDGKRVYSLDVSNPKFKRSYKPGYPYKQGTKYQVHEKLSRHINSHLVQFQCPNCTERHQYVPLSHLVPVMSHLECGDKFRSNILKMKSNPKQTPIDSDDEYVELELPRSSFSYDDQFECKDLPIWTWQSDEFAWQVVCKKSDEAFNDGDVKIPFTSRPHAPVRSHIAGVVEIALDTQYPGADITNYVKDGIARLDRIKLPFELRDETQKVLIDGANGMFLWVSLMLDELHNSKRTTRNAIQANLKILPKDLPKLYRNILNKIEPDDLEIAKTILQWVVWATRPLHLRELAVAIAVLRKHTSITSMQGDIDFNLESEINRIFGSLVKIEDNTVHLVHQSAKEFLCDPSNNSNTVSMDTTNRLFHELLIPTEKTQQQYGLPRRLFTIYDLFASLLPGQFAPAADRYQKNENQQKKLNAGM
jgi:hypothetical protein